MFTTKYDRKIGKSARANWASDPTYTKALNAIANVQRSKPAVKPVETKQKEYWGWTVKNGKLSFGEC